MVRATFPSALKVIYPGGLDASLLREWRSRRPDGLLVFRHYFADENLNTAKFDVTLNAADQIADLHPILEVPINEAHQTSPDDIARLSDYSVHFVDQAASEGYKAAVGVFSEGNPSNLDWWANFYPALRAARQHGGYLALHEYFTPGCYLDGWHSLRYRKVWNVLPDDCKIPILVTECGIDGGIDAPDGHRPESGWRAYCSATEYAGLLRGYHLEMAKDAYVHGATIFLCGGNSQWQTFDITDEVDLRPPLTENVAMPPRWTPHEEPTVPDIVLNVPMRTSLAAPENYGQGPRASTIGVVIHTTRGGASTVENEYIATINWFQNPTAQVSAHLIVGGGTFPEACRSVHDDDVAWHCREANATHLGIEIAQALPTSPISDFQYVAAADACRKWAAKYGFPLTRVMSQNTPGLVGHEETEAGKRDGKTDPGMMFDWPRFLRLVQGGSMPTDPTALRDKTWALADQLQKLGADWRTAGYPHHASYVENQGEAIKDTVAISKQEK